MYIAFKWLVSLALTMWLAMCFTNIFLKETNRRDRSMSDQTAITMVKGNADPLDGSTLVLMYFVKPPFFNIGMYRSFGLSLKNISKTTDHKLANRGNISYSYNKEQSMAALHLMMFVAGALAVSVINKKQEIMRFTKRKLANMNVGYKVRKFITNLKYPANFLIASVLKVLRIFWEIVMSYGWKLVDYITMNALKTTQSLKQRKLYTVMLHKLKEIGEERKKLGQLLVSAIQENKNIRMQYQLETMAKNRLAQHIENTNKQIKENRSKYTSFQHLYLVTHQENLFLKARIRKLTKEKEDIEKNLMGLINEVYKTKNNELKTYCSRYIVKTKDNLLNSDVSAEIEKFLRRTSNTPGASNGWHPGRLRAEITSSKSWPLYAGTRISEVLQDESLVPLVSDAPKLKGLPGEYVWTVKDKDGIIEKLYEYESEFDNGDTIRRIRQYSVYYDKDCLLDFTNAIQEPDANFEISDIRRHRLNVEPPLESRRIVSGSEAFKKFLRNNKSIMPLPSTSIRS